MNDWIDEWVGGWLMDGWMVEGWMNFIFLGKIQKRNREAGSRSTRISL